MQRMLIPQQSTTIKQHQSMMQPGALPALPPTSPSRTAHRAVSAACEELCHVSHAPHVRQILAREQVLQVLAAGRQQSTRRRRVWVC
jgi:hypothetical protein